MVILFQLLIVVAVSLGWMYWLNKLTTDGNWCWRRSILLFGAGFAAQVLLLQNLVYLDLPVKYSYPLPALIGLAGLWRLIGIWRTSKQFDPAFRRNARYAASIFVVISSLQSGPAIWEGNAHYYGKGHIDQLNYTLISEFIKSEPFSTPMAEMQKRPWLVKAVQQKDNRIGQSVAQAYVASLSFVSAKESYAALCSFLVALLSLSLYAVAQSFSIKRSYCVLAAGWVGVAPSTTHIHLDGFLSQAAVLFVFPLLLLWARLPAESVRFRIGTGAILSSYLLVTYTELFLVGLFSFFLLTIAFALVWSPRQLWLSTATVGLGVLLVPAYVPRAYNFVLQQYSVASVRVDGLEALAPYGGTIYGWARTLIFLPVAPPSLERTLTTAVGILFLALCAVGLVSRSRRNRLTLAAAALTPTVFLAILLAREVLARYPFQKICDSFAFLWILLVIRGLAVLAAFARKQWSVRSPALVHALPAGFLLFGLCGIFPHQAIIAAHHGALRHVNTPEFKSTLRHLAAHPEHTYIIHHTGALAAGYLAYAARHSAVFVSSGALSDVPLSPGTLLFTTLPENLDHTTLVTQNGFFEWGSGGREARVDIDNPQGEDGGEAAYWYWLGDDLQIDVFRWSDEAPREYTLSFLAEPGPANPSPARTLRLTSLRTGERHTLQFAGPSRVTVPVIVASGRNTFRLQSVEPVEHMVRISNDPRKHMNRIQGFNLGSPKALAPGDPRLSQLAARQSVPLPLLTPHNPQQQDRSGERVWYWIGKQMELEVLRTDDRPENLDYELVFAAQAGPANPDPRRTIRIRNNVDNQASDVTFIRSAQPSVIFTARPGSTRLTIEVLSPTEQTVRYANDPRVHMVRAEGFRVMLVRASAPPPHAGAPARPIAGSLNPSLPSSTRPAKRRPKLPAPSTDTARSYQP